jgi:uncharacterized membrane protein YccC
VAYGVSLATSCLVSYWLITHMLARIHYVSDADNLLGGMWAVIATMVVYRFSYRESLDAALSRMSATLVSFALCITYLLFLSFSPWGMAALIAVGAVCMILLGHPEDTVTTGITTAVVMVVAALSPRNAWQQPILRLVDTMVGVAVGIAAAWIGRRANRIRRRGSGQTRNQ